MAPRSKSIDMSAEHVEILLSTYNGAKHLHAFLSSLLDQDHDDWSLIVRDDGSSDGTPEVIRDWQARFPDRIRPFEGPCKGNVGVIRSFSSLLEASSAAHVMLADQDDIWLPEKVRLTLDAMRRQEKQATSGRPILVHTDLIVVDQELRTLAPSSWAYQGLVPGRGRPFSRIMVENVVWGCTAMLNRPLVELVGSIPVGAVHHDWWIALVAAAFGDIVALRESRILWRRHELNASPIANIDLAALWALSDIGSARRKLATLFAENRHRVELFLEEYQDRLSQNDVEAAKAFLRLPERSVFSRRMDIIRHGLFFGSSRRNLGLLALL